jgi:hypothetical protein
MRTVTPEEFAVYKLDELEPDARQRAIEGVAGKLGGDWWDSADTDDISDVIRWTLAEKFGTPGYDQYGVGDFPGIPGVTLAEWDLERSEHLGLTGVLDRENAPALPWAAGVEDVVLSSARYGTDIDVRWDEDALDPDQERDLTVVRAECLEQAGAVRAAVETAISEAISAGRAEMEYKTSAEYAKQWIEANETEFLADGTLYA